MTEGNTTDVQVLKEVIWEVKVRLLKLPNKKLPVTDQEMNRKGPNIGNRWRQGAIIIMLRLFGSLCVSRFNFIYILDFLYKKKKSG